MSNRFLLPLIALLVLVSCNEPASKDHFGDKQLSGTVTGLLYSGMTPLRNVMVNLLLGEDTLITTTDSLGDFSFDIEEYPGSYHLIFSRSDCVTVDTTINIPERSTGAFEPILIQLPVWVDYCALSKGSFWVYESSGGLSTAGCENTYTGIETWEIDSISTDQNTLYMSLTFTGWNITCTDSTWIDSSTTLTKLVFSYDQWRWRWDSKISGPFTGSCAFFNYCDFPIHHIFTAETVEYYRETIPVWDYARWKVEYGMGVLEGSSRFSINDQSEYSSITLIDYGVSSK